MAILSTSISHIADDPKYRTEKPYFIIPVQGGALDPETDRVTNLQYERHQVEVGDVRAAEPKHTIETNGFTLCEHKSDYIGGHDKETVQKYRLETQEHLKQIFPDAELVLTWDFRASQLTDRRLCWT